MGIKGRESLTRHNIKNYSTATQFPAAVKKYIDKEKQEGALLGPFAGVYHESFHVSPLLSRPKDIEQLKIVVDLSYVDNTVNKVTEKGIHEGKSFTLQLPTMDHIIAQIQSLNSPSLIKADIARAFCNVYIDPRDPVKCGIAHEGQ